MKKVRAEDEPFGVASMLFQYSMDFWADNVSGCQSISWRLGRIPSIEASGGGAVAIVG